MAEENEPGRSIFTRLPLLAGYAMTLMFGGCVGLNVGYVTATTISPGLRESGLLVGGDRVVELYALIVVSVLGGGYLMSRLVSTVGSTAARKKLRKTDEAPGVSGRSPRQPSDNIEPDDNRRRIEGR